MSVISTRLIGHKMNIKNVLRRMKRQKIERKKTNRTRRIFRVRDNKFIKSFMEIIATHTTNIFKLMSLFEGKKK